MRLFIWSSRPLGFTWSARAIWGDCASEKPRGRIVATLVFHIHFYPKAQLCRIKVVLGESIAIMAKRKGGGGNSHDRAVARAAGTNTGAPSPKGSKKALPDKIENTRRKRARTELFVTALGFPIALLLMPKNPLTVGGLALGAGLVFAHAFWVYSENLLMPFRLMFSLFGLLVLVYAGLFSEFYDVNQNLTASTTIEDGAQLQKAYYTVHNGASSSLSYGEIGCIPVSLVRSNGDLVWTGRGEPLYTWSRMGQAGPVESGNDVRTTDCLGIMQFPNQEMSCLDMIVTFQYRIEWLGFFTRIKRFRFLGTFHDGKTTFVPESAESVKSGDWISTYCESSIKRRDTVQMIQDSTHAPQPSLIQKLFSFKF